MSVSGSGNKPNYNDPEFLKKLKDPELAKKMKDGMDLLRSSKNSKLDPEVKGIKGKYFGSEPTVASSDGKVKNLDKNFKRKAIQEDNSQTGMKASKEIPSAPMRDPRFSNPPSRGLPPLPISNNKEPKISTQDKLPVVAKDVLNPISKNANITKRPEINMNELKFNPKVMQKEIDNRKEVKQSPEDVRAEQEFADKAKGLGYQFHESGMYVPIEEGFKEPLTEKEMTDMVEGKIPNQASFKPNEVKYEGRTSELDVFAAELFLKFDKDAGLYVSDNPFVNVQDATIDEMKELMTSAIEKKKIDEVAKEQGFSPMPGMDGLYENVNGEIRAADEF